MNPSMFAPIMVWSSLNVSLDAGTARWLGPVGHRGSLTALHPSRPAQASQGGSAGHIRPFETLKGMLGLGFTQAGEASRSG